MHRSDPIGGPGRPSRRGRDRRHPSPAAGPPSTLLQPPPETGPLPGHVRVTLRELPQRPPLLRGYRIHPLDVMTVILGIAVIVAIVWPGAPH